MSENFERYFHIWLVIYFPSLLPLIRNSNSFHSFVVTMSDLNQIPKDIIEQNQEEISLINGKMIIPSLNHLWSFRLDNLKRILISDENDLEYEDAEEDEIIDTSILTSITNKSSLKVKIIFLEIFVVLLNLRQPWMTMNYLSISNLDVQHIKRFKMMNIPKVMKMFRKQEVI
jgi:hypothetical protein